MPAYMDHFDGLCSKEHVQGLGRTYNQKGRIDLYYTDDLGTLDKHERKINYFLGVESSGYDNRFEIHAQKTMSLRLGVNEGE